MFCSWFIWCQPLFYFCCMVIVTLFSKFDEYERIYRAKAPLGLGLAGGSTNLESSFFIFGGDLNATINKFAYASLIQGLIK